MAISAGLVRELRERSGAGMMDCKNALEATQGDIDAAFDHLRKQGLKSAEKKANREMGEGRIQALLSNDDKRGSMVAITCETDFVAKTPDFEAFLEGVTRQVLDEGLRDPDALLSQRFADSDDSVEERLKLVVSKLGENIQIGRSSFQECASGFVGSYVHHNNKVGALASLETQASTQDAQALLKELCMHIVFSNPTAMSRDEVTKDAVERERNVLLESDELKKKPAEIQEKILSGRLEKFYSGIVLGEQPWFKDDKQSVASQVEERLGAGSKVVAFSRFQIGS